VHWNLIEMKASKAGKKKPIKKKAAGDEAKGNAPAQKDAGFRAGCKYRKEEDSSEASSSSDECSESDSSRAGVGGEGEQPGDMGGKEGEHKKRMKKKLKKLRVNLSMCKYKVIKEMVEWLGWSTTENETDWQVWWTDMSVGEERCMRLRRPQKLNHFPGMTEVAHKCNLARNLNRLRAVLPELYNFHPETFNLPVDYLAFEHAALGDMEQRKGKGGKSNKTYIIKPDDGACGVGIFITRQEERALSSE
jgi:hypothetical protein